jgi:nucleoside-triphosphatase THEP1
MADTASEPPGAVNVTEMDQSAFSSDLLLLTGSRGAGKTSLLQELVEAAKQARWTLCGLLSPARLENGQKTGIQVIDAHSGTRRLLASRVVGELNGPRIGHWTFDSEAIAWGNDLLKHAPPSNLFVLDELGPLEFDRRQGWTAAFDLLAKPAACRLAIVVVRPNYVEAFLQRCPRAEIVTIQNPAEIGRLARQFAGRYWEQTQPSGTRAQPASP